MRITHTRVAQRELKAFFKAIDPNVDISKQATGWELEFNPCADYMGDDAKGIAMKIRQVARAVQKFFVDAGKPAAMHSEGVREFVGPKIDAAKLEYRVLGNEYKSIRLRRQDLKAIINKGK